MKFELCTSMVKAAVAAGADLASFYVHPKAAMPFHAHRYARRQAELLAFAGSVCQKWLVDPPTWDRETVGGLTKHFPLAQGRGDKLSTWGHQKPRKNTKNGKA